MLEGLLRIGLFLDFAWQVLLAIPSAMFRRVGEVSRQFERVAWGSLPIIVTAGISVGVVTWLQTRRLLTQYSLEAAGPSILSVAVVDETGPMLAGVLVAGRMGAGLAAEMASMVLTEELDARSVLGASPLRTLVAPRVIACALAVPLLTVMIDVSAVAGGLTAEMVGGNLTARLFCDRALDFLKLEDVIPATVKTSVFGLLIGLIGCWTGMNADRSTEAVGHAATRGVVRSMLAVFLSNIVLVKFIAAGVAWWTSTR
jgi:phospholipid/cholesterol/gamma-HCH transport system permease protein